ncbi:MAG: hypothetical protein SF051_04970 [Elusimicrobiota bacterium]|nr:hypothetical protein [Elusimicrobiota bacterium]
MHMHTSLSLLFSLALTVTARGLASGEDAPRTGPLAPNERAAYCAELRGLDFRDDGDRAIATCVFTGVAASPLFCGIRLGHHNGMYLAADQSASWLPERHEQMVIDEDALRALLRVERLLSQPGAAPMRARALAVEHAYFRAAASIVRTKRPDLAARAAALSGEATLAAEDYLASHAHARSLIPVPLAPITSCQQVLAGLMAPIEQERRQQAARERAVTRARDLSQERLEELRAVPLDSPDRPGAERRYRQALRREYEPQIRDAEARTATLQARADRLAPLEERLRSPRIERLRLAAESAHPLDFGMARRAYEAAVARERATLTAHEADYLEFAEARQRWLGQDAAAVAVATDDALVRRRIGGRQGVRDSGPLAAALVPLGAGLNLERAGLGLGYLRDDAGWTAHRALGDGVDAVVEIGRSAIRPRTYRDIGASVSRTARDIDGMRRAILAQRELMSRLPPEQREAAREAAAADAQRRVQVALADAWQGTVDSLRSFSAWYERATRDGDRRQIIIDSGAPRRTPIDPRHALREGNR